MMLETSVRRMVVWDRLWDQVEECDRDIATLTAQRKRARSEQHGQVIDANLLHAKKLRAMIVDKMGERPKR